MFENEIFESLLSNEKYEELVKLCAEKITKEESDILYEYRGKAYEELGEYEKAISDYSHIILAKANSLNSYYRRGICYYFLSNDEDSINDLHYVFSENSNYSEVNFYLGECYLCSGKTTIAIDHFNNHLNINPNDLDCLKSRLLAYNIENNKEKADHDFTQILTSDFEKIDFFRTINCKSRKKQNNKIQYETTLDLIFKNEFTEFKNQESSGVYILEFNNEEYYVGQTKNAFRRLKQHFKKYKDIANVFFKCIEVDFLIEEETRIIELFESNQIRIRNLKQIDFLNIFDENHQQQWCSDITYNFISEKKFNNNELRLKFSANFLKFQQKKYFDKLTELIKKYIQKTIPNYIASEYNYWSITCLPNYLKKYKCVSRININSVPVISVFEKDDSLTFMLYVSKLPFIELLNNNGAQLDSFLKTFPSVVFEFRDAFGDKTQGDELTILLKDNEFEQLLENELFLSSIRYFNLRMMNDIGVETGFRRAITHCLDLSDNILLKNQLLF